MLGDEIIFKKKYEKEDIKFFQSDNIILIDNINYYVEIELISMSTKGKSYTRLKKVKKYSSNNKFIQVCPTKLKGVIYPLLMDSLFKIENEFKRMILVNEQLPNDFTISLNKQIVNIPSNVVFDDDQIKNILTLTENGSKIQNLIFIKHLEEFIESWESLIINNALEKSFQNTLFSFQSLFTLLFGFSDLENIVTENILDEDGSNRTDISNDSFIIELKTPNTPLFNKNNSRKNIYGISSQLASAVNQLNLYKMKADREKKLNDAFTEVVLIIGSNNCFNEERQDKELAWKLFCEHQKIRIYTFDNILEKAKRILESLRK